MFVILCILSCYYNNFVSIFTIGYTSSMSTSFSGCLPCCVKLVPVLCYYCLLSLCLFDRSKGT